MFPKKKENIEEKRAEDLDIICRHIKHLEENKGKFCEKKKKIDSELNGDLNDDHVCLLYKHRKAFRDEIEKVEDAKKIFLLKKEFLETKNVDLIPKIDELTEYKKLELSNKETIMDEPLYVIISSKFCALNNCSYNKDKYYCTYNSGKDFQIPREVSIYGNKYKVLRIGKKAFWLNTMVENVSFENESCLEEIKDKGLDSVTIKSVSLPNSLRIVHPASFGNRIRPFEVNLVQPNCIWFIENDDSLIYHKYPNEVLRVKGSKLKKFIHIRESVTKICGHCFNNSKSTIYLRHIVFPSSLVAIEKYAFKSYNIHKISFKNQSNFKIFKKKAFYECAIDFISFPSSLEVIEGKAFAKCGIKGISFPQNSQLRKIDEYAFMLSKFQRIWLPASLESLGYLSFGLCRQLSLITISLGSQLRLVDVDAFAQCPITQVKCEENVTQILRKTDLLNISNIIFDGGDEPK